VEDFLTALGYPVGHVTVYRDVQEAGKKARELRAGWLKQAGEVKVVGGDPTRARCGGEDVVIGVAVDDREGFTLTIDVLDNEQTETLCEWLLPILVLAAKLFGGELAELNGESGAKKRGPTGPLENGRGCTPRAVAIRPAVLPGQG
jgi:hypothetical protein